MKFLIFLLSSLLCLNSCDDSGYSWGVDVKHTTVTPGKKDTTKVVKDYPDRHNLIKPSDMVLFYGGSNHRTPFHWDVPRIAEYVAYTDKNNNLHWLFDGFLCLEFKLEQCKHTLITGYKDANGYYMESATKEEWQGLIDYYMRGGSGIDAIEIAIDSLCKEYDTTPPYKRMVVVGIPEPIKYKDSHNQMGGCYYWGELNGKTLNFGIDSDRILAVKWFIDEVRKRFIAKNYKHVELSGFYWVAESSSNTATILQSVGDYLNSLSYTFNWIPYFNAKGYDKWKDYGFNCSYLQPNYFFHDDVYVSRLEQAVKNAKEQRYPGMEVEFDENGVYGSWGKGKTAYKFYDYLNEFKRLGVWDSMYLAYYQGSWAIHSMRSSNDPRDKESFDFLCDWIDSRPVRKNHK